MGALKKYLIFLIFCGYFGTIYSQKEASIWYFGYSAGLDFKHTPVLQLNFSAMHAARGCATISDANGNLCFYTDGETVYNSIHQIMMNGSNIGGWAGGIQSAVIVPKPYNNYIYYIFTDNFNNPFVPNKFAYTIVDMSKQNGLGEVISKNNSLQYFCPKFSCTEKLTAVLHSNKSSVWVITHKAWSDSFYCYQVNAFGVNNIPVISRVGKVYNPYMTNRGPIKVSPDGKTLCAVLDGKGFEIFNFNNTNGKITGPFISVDDSNNYIGVEFSPDGSKLYLNEYPYTTILSKIWQIDLKAGNTNQVLNSKTLIASLPVTIGTGQIAIDGKIYIGGGGGGSYNGLVIQNPNLKGAACNFTIGGFNFTNGFSAGLPQFIQSYFFSPNIKANQTCLGDSTKFTLSDTSKIYSALWNFGDTNSGTNNTSTSMSPMHVYSDTGLYQVIAYVYHNGVPDTLTREIRIGLYPMASFTVNDTIQCLKTNRFAFKDSSSIAVGGLSYEWNFGDSKNSFDKNPINIYDLSGTYHAKLSVLSDYGCIDTQTKDLYINPDPKAAFSVSDNIMCFKDNQFKFYDSSVISSGALSRIWKFGDNQTDTTNSIVHTYSSADTFKAALIVSSIYGCKDSSFEQIIVRPTPSASFSISDTILCLKTNLFSFNNNSTISSQESLNFIWNFGDFTTDTTKHPIHQYSVTDTFLVKLIAITQNGCKDSVNKNIFVYPEPKTGFNINDTSQCFSGNLFRFNNSTLGASGFNWDFGDKTTDTITNPSHSYTKAGTFSIKLHAFSQNGCSDSLIKMISIHPQPIPAFNVNDSIQCQNANLFSFINTSSGAKSYFWYFGDLTTESTSNPTHLYSVADTFVVSLMATSQDGCKDSISKKLIVVPSPKAGFILNDSTQCLFGNLFKFSNTTSGAKNNIWHFGNGTTDTASNPVYSYTTIGTYLVKLKVQNIYDCGDSLIRKIEVFPMPSSSFIINTNPQYLYGNSFIFTNQTTITSGTIFYLWNFGDSNTSSLKDPVHNYKTADTFDVKLVAFTINGCKDSVVHKVWLLNPQINAEFQFKDLCLGDYAFFKNTSKIQKDSFLNFLWNFGDGSLPITSKDPKYLYTDTGIYQVQMVALTYKGFKDTVSHFIRVFPSPTVHITADPDTIVEVGITVTLTANGVFDNIFWNTGKSTRNIVVDKTGRYNIRVEAVNGCDASDSIMILFIQKYRFSAMNVITPNGDGINDLWKIDNIDKYQPCKLVIYNRWGDEMYSSNKYQNNWDGTYKGNKLPEGTYYFVLVAKDGKVYKGAVNIVN